jgi:hypothetical protein
VGRERVPAAIAVALALWQAGLLARTAWDKSDTADEPTYIAAAALLWAHRDYSFNSGAPVLPKWGFAAALAIVDPAIGQTPPEWYRAGVHMLWSGRPGRLRRNLFAARSATILVTVLGGLLLWSAARRFGDLAAAATHALWCFSPTILANGALATLDAWVTSMLCAVLWAAVRFWERPAPERAAAAGFFFGLAAAAKVSALGVAPVILVAGALALRRSARADGRPALRRSLFCALSFAAAAFFTLWGLYAFTVGWVTSAAFPWLRGWRPMRLIGPLPFPNWIEGLLQQVTLGGAGHRGYLFGEARRTGWWWFYLAAFALKTTLGAQALAVARVVGWMRRLPARPELALDAALLAYPVLLFLAMSLGRTQIGIRYLLPAFPFAMLWAGRGVVDLRRAFGRVGLAVAGACLLAGAAESLRVHPHHLMFFNLWAGGPEGGPRYFVVGDDWGQDQRRLGEWMRERQVPGIFYTYYCGMPQMWGINYRPPSCAPRRGTYALQAVEVHRPRHIEAGCLDWLTVEPPDERIGYSIYIYQVNKERLDRLAASRGTDRPFWRSGSGPPEPE